MKMTASAARYAIGGQWASGHVELVSTNRSGPEEAIAISAAWKEGRSPSWSSCGTAIFPHHRLVDTGDHTGCCSRRRGSQDRPKRLHQGIASSSNQLDAREHSQRRQDQSAQSDHRRSEGTEMINQNALTRPKESTRPTISKPHSAASEEMSMSVQSMPARQKAISIKRFSLCVCRCVFFWPCYSTLCNTVVAPHQRHDTRAHTAFRLNHGSG